MSSSRIEKAQRRLSKIVIDKQLERGYHTHHQTYRKQSTLTSIPVLLPGLI